DPFDFLNELLDPQFGVDFSNFDDPAGLTYLRSTGALTYPLYGGGTNRYGEYSKLDLSMSRDYAPITGLATIDSFDFFSSRVGCQTFNPMLGMDLVALCPPATIPVFSLHSNVPSPPAGAPTVAISAI